MKVLSFVAEDAKSAIDQILQELGPEAQIVGIRKVPASGLAKLWKKYSRIEILASLPEPGDEQTVSSIGPTPGGTDRRFDREFQEGCRPDPKERFERRDSSATERTSAAVLEKMGLLPHYAEQVLERAEALRSTLASVSLAEELGLLRSALESYWKPAPEGRIENEGPQVFVGPPGSGKTTVLCKWLAQNVLTQGSRGRVWRLDSTRANTAELLSVHCAILGCPEERSWKEGSSMGEGESGFVDLPGVPAGDRAGLDQLGTMLKRMRTPVVHLVLNGAYEVPLLLEQIRAYSSLPIADLILTHLDEERRWTKLWNLVLGTKCSLRYLGAGQNIPGDFFSATPELLMERRFWPCDGRNSPNGTPSSEMATLLLNDEA